MTHVHLDEPRTAHGVLLLRPDARMMDGCVVHPCRPIRSRRA